MSFVKWAAAVTLAALVTMAGGVANANTVTIFNGASQKGTLSDLGGSITFLGYTAPGVLDATSPYTALTATVNPADPGTLVPIANTYFGTTFTTLDEHRTEGGSASLFDLDIDTLFFSVTLGGNQTAFFRNQTGGELHLTYTATGTAAGLSHYSEYGNALAVPGPIVGAGLPGLLMAFGGLGVWLRRRRALAS